MLSILGTGGHARALTSAKAALIPFRLLGKGEEPDEFDGLALGFADNAARQREVAKYGVERFVGIVHPSAVVDRASAIGRAVQIMAGAIIMPGATLGDFVIVNTGAQIDHDCIVGDYAFIAPGAVLLGGAIVEKFAFVGANAVVLISCTVGEDSIVGAGAVVTRDVKPQTIVVGNPARFKRDKRRDECSRSASSPGWT